MKSAARIITWIILAIPFVIPALLYRSIENEVLIYRSLFGDEMIFAPKSLFTVFRVPLIEIICAAAIETIRPKSSELDYFSVWSILLYTIALKSLFQFFEFISLSVFSSQVKATFFFYITFVVVIIGILLVIITGRNIFSAKNRESWKLARLKKIFLVFLLSAYLILAFGPTFIY